MKSFSQSRIAESSSLLLALVFLFSTGAAASQSTPETYVTTTNVNVRKGPGTSYEVVTTVPKGVKVNVVGREGAWLKVESKHGNKPGYIHGQYVRSLQDQPSAQTPSAATSVAGPYRTLRETDLREGPGLQHRIAAKLPADVKVNVLRAEGDWLRVESKRGNKPGYVEKRDVERWVDR
jgi:uncharacterized protein YgiM (DUF1202 family)